MTDQQHCTPAALAIFTLAEIKAAIESFDRGDSNVGDALNAIIEAIDDFRTAAIDRSRREAA
jgi:hypothetical protein